MKTAAILSALVVAGSTSAAVIDIAVGGTAPQNPLQFSPANVTAQVGDVVRFTFSGSPGNHSVTQSAFTAPCQPLAGGFDSGNILIPSNFSASDAPQWNLTITNTSKPLWFYCKQLKPNPHCDSGMVGSINAPLNGTNTYEAFQASAKNQTGPSGQSVGNLVGVGASASAEVGPLGSSISAFGTPNPSATAPAASGASGSNTGSGSGASPTSAATGVKAGSFVVLLSTLFGIVLA